jgi:hypothetical protein
LGGTLPRKSAAEKQIFLSEEATIEEIGLEFLIFRLEIIVGGLEFGPTGKKGKKSSQAFAGKILPLPQGFAGG